MVMLEETNTDKLGLKPAKQRFSSQVCFYRSQLLHVKYSVPL